MGSRIMMQPDTGSKEQCGWETREAEGWLKTIEEMLVIINGESL